MMIKVDIQNDEILSYLNSYSDWFFKQNIEDRHRANCAEYTASDADTIVSNERLEEIKQDPDHIGFPLLCKGVDLNGWVSNDPEWAQRLEQFQFDFKRLLGAKHSALHMYYPQDGFISWHTNENAPGRNLILSYSTDGKGFFRYQDPITKEIITIQDEPGWNAKMGSFGNTEETKVWHCARNYGPRLTISYIIDNPSMWEDLKDELEDHEYK